MRFKRKEQVRGISKIHRLLGEREYSSIKTLMEV
nr:MAG TPA: hypothetical protein [Caudoviricetes sp.]